MDARLEAVHRHLPEDGRHRVVDLLDEQGEAFGRVFDAATTCWNVSISPKTDAVSAVVSGVSAWKTPWLAGEILVDAVAELVRERLHVAQAAGVVEQDVRVRARDGAVAEGAAALARHGRRVDPAAVEKAVDDVAELGQEGAVGGRDGGARLGPTGRAGPASPSGA